jgi:hypothetical protein
MIDVGSRSCRRGLSSVALGCAGPVAISPYDGKRFAPSKSSFMVNYRVQDLPGLLQALRDEGCNVLEKTDDSEYGKFGWVMDPEGNKVELWQPPPGQ